MAIKIHQHHRGRSLTEPLDQLRKCLPLTEYADTTKSNFKIQTSMMAQVTRNKCITASHSCFVTRRVLQRCQLTTTSCGILVAILSCWPTSTSGLLAKCRSPGPRTVIRLSEHFHRTVVVSHNSRLSRGCCKESFGVLSVSTTSGDSDPKSFAEQLRSRYNDKETDGILELATSPSFLANKEFDDVEKLISAILEAVGENKGAVASVLNALIGSCILHASAIAKAPYEEGTKSLLTDRVNSLMLAYDELQETKDINPDVVTLSLAYTAFHNLDEDDPKGQRLATTVLEQAQRRTKKIAGGRRRKQLVSLSRKAKSTFFDEEEHLKDLLGDDFQVLLETAEFAVINKPSGVPCFHRKATTAGKIKKGKKGNGIAADTTLTSSGSATRIRPDISLEDAVVSRNIPLSTLNPDALGLVHRLDRGSSGCMVIAKTDVAHARLVAEFFLRRTSKVYTTLVEYDSSSSLTSKDGGMIELPVDGRPARSKYHVLERYESLNAAMVEFEIFTGRKHQIRVHTAKGLGSPVMNDGLYSNRPSNNVDSSGGDDDRLRFFLHASKLRIPTFDIDVEAPIPSWWVETIPSLRNTVGE